MKLDVKFNLNAHKFKAVFSEQDGNFRSGFGEISTVTEYVDGEPYEGSYDIIPKTTMQTLLTKGKYLIDDITLRAIPVSRVSNSSGGTTVYIASEV